jgi:hypothetical protein
MNDQTSVGAGDDAQRAELVAEIGERLRRGEKVRPEDYPQSAEILRELLPTIQLMAELPTGRSVSRALGRLGDFSLLREVSRGGMGVVYEAIQVSLGRRVAFKVLPNAAALDPRYLQRFQVEAQAAASLHHPHIVPVFATGSAQGMPYYAMRFIDGRDLARVIRELRCDEPADTEADPREPDTFRPLSVPGPARYRQIAQLARQAAEALDHAHSSDVLHRDIKPSNLMIDDAGDLWITDFGLARMRGGLDLTRTGDALGTPRYMSPEQALGRRTPLDGRTDIYSLGVTLYELLTLRPPFVGDDRIEVLRQIAQGDPTPPRKLDPAIPVDLETIVLKAMAKIRADRYATAADLAADLGNFLDNRPILARRPSLADRTAKWMRRSRALVTAATAGLAILLIGFAAAALQYTEWLKRHNAVLQAAVDRAERNAREALRSAREADRKRRLADRHFLAAQLRLAQQAIDARQFEVAQELLDAVAPDAGAGDSGEFAWNYLRRLAHRELSRPPERSTQLRPMAVSGDRKTAAAWWAAAFSPDGKILATGSDDTDQPQTIKLWAPASARLLRGWNAGQGTVASLSFSHDGRTLASGHITLRDNVRLWDVESGRLRHTLRGHRDTVQSVAFAPDGRMLASAGGSKHDAGADWAIHLWDVETATCVHQLEGHSDIVRSLAFSPDGRILATASNDTTVRLWDAHTGLVLQSQGSPAPLVALAFAPDGGTIMVADETGLVTIRDAASLGVQKTIRGPSDKLLNLAVAPDGRSLATCGMSGTIRLWDTLTGQELLTLQDHKAQVNGIAFAPDDSSLASCSHDGQVKLWRAR